MTIPANPRPGEQDRGSERTENRFASRPLAKLAELAKGLPSRMPAEPPEPAPTEHRPFADALAGKLVIAREARGRGGKTVTIVRGILGREEQLEALARELRRELGTGAKVEDGALVVQGALTERVARSLEQRGAARIVIGN